MNKTLSSNITDIMRSRNLSALAFSKLLNISKSALNRILKGNGNVRMDLLENIAASLEVTPEDLITKPGRDKEEPFLIASMAMIEPFASMSPEEQSQAKEIISRMISNVSEQTDSEEISQRNDIERKEYDSERKLIS